MAETTCKKCMRARWMLTGFMLLVLTLIVLLNLY